MQNKKNPNDKESKSNSTQSWEQKSREKILEESCSVVDKGNNHLSHNRSEPTDVQSHTVDVHQDVTIDINLPDIRWLKRKDTLRFSVVLSFILWPITPILLVLFSLLRRITPKKYFNFPSHNFFSLLYLWCMQPVYILTIASKRRNSRIIFALFLLMPLFLTTLWGIYVSSWNHTESINFASSALQSPLQYSPMGTDGQGRSVFAQIAAGARNSYFSSLIAVIIATGFGLFLGKLTDNSTLDNILSLGIQLIETIPMLFFLMIIFAIFSDMSSILNDVDVRDFLRMITLGVVLGVGFSPPVFHLVRDKILFFKTEDFVSATKAHGISQKAIIWRHIILKNTLSDLLVLAVQIWGFAMLMEISLNYVFSIGAAKLGGEPYSSWAWMLLTPESKNALIGNVDHIFINWWLWFFPVFFISVTIVGFYMFGDALKQWHSRKDQPSVVEDNLDSNFERILMTDDLLE